MWDEEDDNKLREAAGSFQPPLDEGAWNSMEKLLDEHLPVGKKKKRYIFFIPVILLLCILFLWFNSSDLFKNYMTPAASKQDETAISGKHPQIDNAKPNSAAIQPRQNAVKENSSSYKKEFEKAVLKPGLNNQFDEKGSEGQTLISKNKSDKSVSGEQQNIADSKPTNNENFHSDKNIGSTTHSDTTNFLSQKITKDSAIASLQNDTTPVSHSIKQKQKESNKNPKSFTRKFTIGVAAGPGLSFVGNQNGKITVDAGLTIGYRFTKQLGIHTGIFISKKIYAASPDDYFTGGTTYNYLSKIDANCKVIDIPLSLDFYLPRQRKHEWFASAGLSSYLMKKESYDYIYKLPGGESYVKNQTIANQNKHYFSVLDLSAGYNYFLDDHFSISAQPYAELPLTGIGAGKVKLNTAGILFSVKVKPFLHSKK